MLSLNTLIDSSRRAHVVGCGNKTKKNSINESACIDTLNKSFNPLNEMIYCSKELRENVIVVLHEIGVILDQRGKRSCTNFLGGNIKFGVLFENSCHYKDLQDKIPSCSKCKSLLIKRDNNFNYEDLLKWNILNGKYSKIVTDENLETTTKPYKLTIKLHEEQAKKVFSVIVERK